MLFGQVLRRGMMDRVKRIKIRSNRIGFEPTPEPDEEVEQHLTIHRDGRVLFVGYCYGKQGKCNQKARSKLWKIDQLKIERLFEAIETCFSSGFIEIFAKDTGLWKMDIIDMKGERYPFLGSLCDRFDYEGTDLSDMIREILGMDDLYVFDGNNGPDMITRIELSYRRESLSSSNVCSEHFIIDRATGTLEYIQAKDEAYRVTQKFEIGDVINDLLDSFDADNSFFYCEEDSDEVLETDTEKSTYRLTIDYKKESQYVVEGRFDKHGLPEDFPKLAETISAFLYYFSVGELFDPQLYRKTHRCQSEYIFCSVRFSEGQKSYYYWTDDDSIGIGDYVVVPAGKNNHEAIVQVVNVAYFDKDETPLPIEHTKKIIRKYIDETLDES